MDHSLHANSQQSSSQETKQPVHLQSELPIQGTALNPIETEWSMNEEAAAMPVDQLANAMQQGE